MDKLLVLDTNIWLFHYGLGSKGTVVAVRALVEALKAQGYKLAYTNVALVEVGKSPRPEIARVRGRLLAYIRRIGQRVGPGYWDLVARLDAVPGDRRDDAAVNLAAGGNLVITTDSWLA